MPEAAAAEEETVPEAAVVEEPVPEAAAEEEPMPEAVVIAVEAGPAESEI